MLAALIAGPATAADVNWDAGTGDWNTGGNWDTGSVPASVDDAFIDNGGTALLTTPGTEANRVFVGDTDDGTLAISDGGTLELQEFEGSSQGVNIGAGGGTGSVTIDGDGSSLSLQRNARDAIRVGISGTGTLTVTGGGVADNFISMRIGTRDGGTGTVTVDGTGSLVEAADQIEIAARGTGTLTVKNNATAVSSDRPLELASISGTGTLNIGDGGGPGVIDSAAVDGGDGTATLVFDHTGGDYHFTDDGTTAGTAVSITGSTAVEHQAGTTTLAGDSTYSGGTTLSGGTLRLAHDSALGSGGLTVDGAGATLGYAGGVTIGNGIDLQNDLTLDTDAGVEATHGGDIGESGGSHGITKTGTGTLILSGTNTYTGATTVDAGTLRGDTDALQGDITNNAAVTFDQAGEGTYGGDMDGTGTLTKTGTGTLILAGTNPYSGATTVGQGTLQVNGSIADSATTVGTGGTLGGTGTTGAVSLSGGTLAPGNSIGTLTVAGADFSGGGVLEVEVDAAGNADRLDVTGTATLDGGDVSVLPQPGEYALETTYTILEAGTITGEFDSVAVDIPEFAFLDPSLAYTATLVTLTLQRNDLEFGDVAATPNQQAVADTLTALAGDNAAITDLLEALFVLDAGAAQAAFESLGGARHANAQAIFNNLSSRFQTLLLNRLGSGFFTGTPQTASLGSDTEPSGRNAGDAFMGQGLSGERGLWLHGFGGFGDIDDTANARGADYDSHGLAFGADADLGNNLTLGAALGYARTDAATFGGNLDVDSYQIATYGGWSQDAWYVNGSLGAGIHETDSRRQVMVGTLSNTAIAGYDSYNVSVALEGGRHFDLDNGLRVTPLAGLEYTYLNRDAFTETGAGAANLAVDEETQDSLRSKLGLNLQATMTVNDMTIEPVVEAAYVREHLDDSSRITAGFAGAPNATFTVAGPELDRDRLAMGAGVRAHFNETSSLHVGYQGELAGSDDRHNFSATFRMRW